MKIEEPDFTMEYDDDSSKFDLYLLHVVNAKDPVKRREELKLYGYSISFEGCLQIVANFRLSKKVDVLDLKTYLDEYKKELRTLQNIRKLV